MRKFVLFFFLLAAIILKFPENVSAAATACRGVLKGTNVSLPYWRDNPPNNYTHTFSIDMSGYDKSKEYKLCVSYNESVLWAGSCSSGSENFRIDQNKTWSNDNGTVSVNNSIVTWVIKDGNAFYGLGSSDPSSSQEAAKKYINIVQSPGFFSDTFCTAGYYTTTAKDIGNTCKMSVWQERDGNECSADGCMEPGTVTTVKIEGLTYNDVAKSPFDLKVRVQFSGGEVFGEAENGTVEVSFLTGDATRQDISVYSDKTFKDWEAEDCSYSFNLTTECGASCKEDLTNVVDSSGNSNFNLCDQVGDVTEKSKCVDCIGGKTLNGKSGVWTAIGCIPIEPEGIIKTLITLGLSLGGGITLLLILAGAFRLSVSQGDPKQAEEAKEQITSAVIGLLFIIFSIVMLRFIGIQVLSIPGFGG